MFIVLEGLDGAGKSEVSKLLASSIDACIYRTPPDEFKQIRNIVDSAGCKRSQFYYYISGVFYASAKIKELTSQGQSVICDRYYYSTLSYFSDLPESQSIDTSKFLQPDYSFFLDVADDAVREARVLSRAPAGWAEQMCAINDERLRIISSYKRFNLIQIETSRLTIAEVVGEIRGHVLL
jgi:thymidylate kinase